MGSSLSEADIKMFERTLLKGNKDQAEVADKEGPKSNTAILLLQAISAGWGMLGGSYFLLKFLSGRPIAQGFTLVSLALATALTLNKKPEPVKNASPHRGKPAQPLTDDEAGDSTRTPAPSLEQKSIQQTPAYSASRPQKTEEKVQEKQENVCTELKSGPTFFNGLRVSNV